MRAAAAATVAADENGIAILRYRLAHVAAAPKPAPAMAPQQQRQQQR